MLWATYSGDGLRIISGGFDATVKVWDANTGAELLTFTGPGMPFRAALISPDGKTLAAGGDDMRLYLWAMPDKTFANTPTAGRSWSASSTPTAANPMLKELLTWAPLSVSKPLTASDRRDNFPQPRSGGAGVRPWRGRLPQARRLPSDPQRLAPGVRDANPSGRDQNRRRGAEAARRPACIFSSAARCSPNADDLDEATRPPRWPKVERRFRARSMPAIRARSTISASTMWR